MENSNISIKAISELLKYNFFIPSYQRGYRWTEQQVTDLLKDVWEFINKPNKKDEDCELLASQFDFSGGQIDNIVPKNEINEIINGKKMIFKRLFNFAKKKN